MSGLIEISMRRRKLLNTKGGVKQKSLIKPSVCYCGKQLFLQTFKGLSHVYIYLYIGGLYIDLYINGLYIDLYINLYT